MGGHYWRNVLPSGTGENPVLPMGRCKKNIHKPPQVDHKALVRLIILSLKDIVKFCKDNPKITKNWKQGENYINLNLWSEIENIRTIQDEIGLIDLIRLIWNPRHRE